MMASRPLAPPPASPDSAEFAAAAKEGRFLIRRCTNCGKPHWYPRPLCPFCFGATEWEPALRTGHTV